MQEISAIIIVAVSLSMDTFSLSMAYGMLNLKKNVIKYLSLAVGVFHFFMPIIGNYLGEYILTIIPVNPSLIIGIVFFILSIQIFLSLFKEEEVSPIESIFSILFFSLTVSLDSFSVGIGINAITTSHILSSTIFMIISAIFTYAGLKMGKTLNKVIGKKAQVLGMILLFVLSINYILKGC